jgi:hypothetical protein
VDYLLPGMEVLRFENLEESFKDKFGFDLPHHNASNTKDWTKYYDTESELIVRTMYQDAFCLLKYDYL